MKKKNVLALAGVLAVCAVGGTMAYFNQTMEAENVFDTGKYGSTMVEDFKPSEGQNWEPGATVNKVVKVVNTGNLPVVVRVKMDEKWINKDDDTLIKEASTAKAASDAAKAAGVAGANQLVTVYQGDPEDGQWAVDDSVVKKALNESGKWIYREEDGYYYYADELGAGDPTDAFLESVTLIENADMGQYAKKKYYTFDADEATENWVEFPTDSKGEYVSEKDLKAEIGEENYAKIQHFKSDIIPGANPGYSNADYTLTITSQTVQATKQAVNAVFGNNSEFTLKGTSWSLRDETVGKQ